MGARQRLSISRRRTVALLAAGALAANFGPRLAYAKDCTRTKDFGEWKAQAGLKSAFVSKLYLFDPINGVGIPSLTIYFGQDEPVLILQERGILPSTEQTLTIRNASSEVIFDEPFCGECEPATLEDQYRYVFPRSVNNLLDSEGNFQIIYTNNKGPFVADIDSATVRKGLTWAVQESEAAKKEFAADACEDSGCFITTACCEVVGLDDNCFELESLRCFRDEVLLCTPGGAEAIATYYCLAPRILRRLSRQRDYKRRLRSVYARYILPAAIAANLRLDVIAYRLYVRMLRELGGKSVPVAPMLNLAESLASQTPGLVIAGLSNVRAPLTLYADPIRDTTYERRALTVANAFQHRISSARTLVC